jgi:hypothetical protein
MSSQSQLGEVVIEGECQNTIVSCCNNLSAYSYFVIDLACTSSFVNINTIGSLLRGIAFRASLILYKWWSGGRRKFVARRRRAPHAIVLGNDLWAARQQPLSCPGRTFSPTTTRRPAGRADSR